MRKTNDAGIDLIKSFEGLRLTAYQDSGGIWTIGYGHTGGVKRGQRITKDEAESFLREDLDEAEATVEDVVTVDLSDNQFAALVSFAYNVGPGKKGEKDGFVTLKSGRPPTLLRKLNAGDYDGAADEFLKWNHQGGRVLTGLTRRRKAERSLFLMPDESKPAETAPVASSTTEVVKTTEVTETPTGTKTEETSLVSKIAANEQVKTIASEGVGKLATKAITGLTAASTVSTAGAAEASNPWPWIILAIVCLILTAGVVYLWIKHKSDKEKQIAIIASDRDRTDVKFTK